MDKQQNKFGNWLKTSLTARMLMIGVLIIVLLIPLSYIEALISERASRQESVIQEINEKWGKEVLLYGPILKIPYKTYTEKIITTKDSKNNRTEKIETINYAYFFPKKLEMNATIHPEEKKRGIYTTSVYTGEISINGSYEKPDFSTIDINEEDILWDKTSIIIKTSNLKGINNQVIINFKKHKFSFLPKYEENHMNLSNEIYLNKLETNYINKEALPIITDSDFTIKFNISGSKQIRMVPIGKETDLTITSNWKTANFIGNFLPLNSDKITENGFKAKWKVLRINRDFSQEYFKILPNLKKYAFGVNFMIPIDEYQKSERSAKYGFLVISLTFLIFFLIQSISKINIHPFQYLMIGLALTMFYTLLISISEHSNFLKAYLVAGSSVILLITLYSKSILKTFKFPLFIGASLLALYTFIFVIIQLENYALLVGSIGIFLILSIIMYASRKIDWS